MFIITRDFCKSTLKPVRDFCKSALKILVSSSMGRKEEEEEGASQKNLKEAIGNKESGSKARGIRCYFAWHLSLTFKNDAFYYLEMKEVEESEEWELHVVEIK